MRFIHFKHTCFKRLLPVIHKEVASRKVDDLRWQTASDSYPFFIDTQGRSSYASSSRKHFIIKVIHYETIKGGTKND